MKNSSTCIFYLMIAFCIIFTASCGDSSAGSDPDDEGPGGGGGVDFGEVSFTVTGAMQGSFTGTTFFDNYETDDYWELNMSDVLGGGLSNMTFDLSFFAEAGYRPGQGTYPVRSITFSEIVEGQRPEIFPATFEYFEDGFDVDGGDYYATYMSTNACPHPEHGGTLTIISSSVSEIRGSFEMTLLNTDQGASCTALGEVHIEGEFRAVNADDLE